MMSKDWTPPQRKFLAELKPTYQIIEAVDSDHVGLEGMALMSAICDASNRAILFIGVSGTGKSTVCEWMKQSARRQVIMPHGVTTNGMKHYQDQLAKDKSDTFLVEDLSRSGTQYMQVNTVALLAAMSYTGFVHKHTQGFDLDIDNCKMSALIYAQPLILKTLVSVSEFESDIKDKCLRYYHLQKPLKPKRTGLQSNVTWKTIDRVTDMKFDDDEEVISNLRAEVSEARAQEHCEMLLAGSALVNGRKEVIEADKWLVRKLTRNFRFERFIYTKEHLEGERKLHVDALPLFTMFLTFPSVTVKSIMEEYGGLRKTTTEKILAQLDEWVYMNGGRVHPTKALLALLKETVAL